MNKHAISIAAAAIAGAIGATGAEAATFILDYRVTETFVFPTSAPSSLFVGDTGELAATVPDALFTGFGIEEFDPFTGLKVTVDIFGQTFTEEDDQDYDFNPFLRLVNGAPTYFEFNVSESVCCGGNATEIDNPLVLAFSISGGEILGVDDDFNFIYQDEEIETLDVTATVVPLPPAAALLAGAFGIFGFAGWRRRPR